MIVYPFVFRETFAKLGFFQAIGTFKATFANEGIIH